MISQKSMLYRGFTGCTKNVSMKEKSESEKEISKNYLVMISVRINKFWLLFKPLTIFAYIFIHLLNQSSFVFLDRWWYCGTATSPLPHPTAGPLTWAYLCGSKFEISR